MRRRVFWSISAASFVTLLLSCALVFALLYGNSTEELQPMVQNEAAYIQKAMELSGNYSPQYLERLSKDSASRITLTDSGGTVLYDNLVSADTLENHADRPEIKKALESGTGESVRYSDTLGERTYYYAVLLSNGEVLRVAVTTASAWGLMKQAIGWFLLIAAGILLLSLVFAGVLTRSIVRPLNGLNLEDPLSNDAYEELSPLLRGLDAQNKKIEGQIKELKARRQEFDTVTGAMNEGLAVFGEQGNILSANNSIKRIFGSDDDGTYLQLCRDVSYIRAVESALKGAAAEANVEKDGRIYRLSASPVGGTAAPFAAVLFVTDITDIERSEAMRREFSANVSHELKTPLTSIMGCAEIIENGIAKADDVSRFAGQIRAESARLLTLIEDIIRLSRLDEGIGAEEFLPVELSEVCDEALSALSDKAEKKKIELTFKGEPIQIDGIRPVLHEMIYNLCDNAITYNKEGGSVTVVLKEIEGKKLLTVEDTGIGIAPEHKERVFERFYRVDKSHSTSTGQTGLGLSIVKHAARLHNARIELKSEVGKGTRVSVIFDE